MMEREQHDPSWPENEEYQGDKRRPFTPDTSGRAKRGSDFRDADLHEPPVEDPDDQIPDQ